MKTEKQGNGCVIVVLRQQAALSPSLQAQICFLSPRQQGEACAGNASTAGFVTLQGGGLEGSLLYVGRSYGLAHSYYNYNCQTAILKMFNMLSLTCEAATQPTRATGQWLNQNPPISVRQEGGTRANGRPLKIWTRDM